MSSTCNPDIIRTLERQSQDYLGVYGVVSFVVDAKKHKTVAEKCGSKSFRTIEFPVGFYELSLGRGKRPYPYQQKQVCIKDPLEKGPKDTSPSSLAKVFSTRAHPVSNPSKPADVEQEDYERALGSSLRISKRGEDPEKGDKVFCHSGRTSIDSWLCPMVGPVGKDYIQTERSLDYLYPPQSPPPPGLEVGKKYSFKSFTAADSLKAQLEMNLWFIKVEKELGRPPDLKYQRKGNVSQEAGKVKPPLPLPQPIP